MHHSELRIACALQRPPSARIPLQALIAYPSPLSLDVRQRDAPHSAYRAPPGSWCSFRLFSVSLRLLLVAGYQLLKDGPQTRGLSLVMFTPRYPHLFAAAVLVPAHALHVQGLELV